MKHETIVAGDVDWIGKVAKTCGEVTVGCTDVGGVILDVIGSSTQLNEQQRRLSEVIHRFAADQKAAADASDEARMLSERARARLAQGVATVKQSGEELTQLIDLAQGLGHQITGFAAAVEQVSRVSQTIDQIARTTNMLALNAAIEAQKAGAAGATFAVVAAEVKKLASDTRTATVEISTTMHSLGQEAQRFITRVEEGARHSQAARAHLTDIDQAMSQAGEIVALVDEQSDEIARRAAAAHGEVLVSQDVLASFAQANSNSDRQLRDAHSHILQLESLANDMFDALVHSGASPIDSHFVAMAQEEAQQVVALTEAALASGELGPAALFDTDYTPIEGSNPPRFRTRLTAFADAHWRPVIDRIMDRDPRISGAIMSDMNGFLPTHSSAASQAPTGELKHDTAYCRNGRIIFGPADQKAKRSTADYMMVVYRQEGDGRNYRVMRNVYVPLHFAGRRWGDLEIAYVL